MTKTITRQTLRAGVALLPVVALGLSAILFAAPAAFAQVAPPLGTTQQFTLLGGSAATGATGLGSQVNGDVGSSPTATISNFPPSTVTPPFILHLANDAVVQQAHLDGITAFNGLNQGAGTVIPDNLTGAILTTGIYTFTTGAPNLPNNTTLTLSGPGVFVLRAGSTLIAGTGSTVNLIGGANPCNVFWQVGSSATLIGVTFSGTIIANTSVTIGSGSNLVGKAIANNGAVTLSGAGTNAVGGCATPSAAVCPVITVSPASLLGGTVGVPYTQVLTASGGVAPYAFGPVTGSLPAGLSLSVGGTLSGTPTSAGSSTFTIRAVDFNACFADRVYTIAVIPPVPTMGEWAKILLFLALGLAGFLGMRKQTGGRRA